MFSSHGPRVEFERNPLAEVICQFRFPTILSIEAHEPADFQEAIRPMFPRYAATQERPAPRMVNPGTPQAHLEPSKPVTNYAFISSDKKWRLNLTKDFIALSTVDYTNWETFAAQLDRPLAEFLRIYRPTFISRIGLRYLNIISRRDLDLEDRRWKDLIKSAYLGPLGADGVSDKQVTRCALDLELEREDSTIVRVHSGPGKVARQGMPRDDETKFVLDFDLSRRGELEARSITAQLSAIHDAADELFTGAIADPLYRALGPTK